MKPQSWVYKDRRTNIYKMVDVKDLSEAQRKEISRQRQKAYLALRAAERAYSYNIIQEQKGGYCKTCWQLRPINGKCPNCD